LFSWGYNNNGQLGIGNTTSYSSPKQVGALTNWLKISSGYRSVLAVKTDGTLWSWGLNSVGQLGLGNTTYYSSPKQIGSLTNWLSVAASYYSSAAIKTDGTLWTWGYNNVYGQLGLGNTTNYSSPKQVGTGTSWSLITGGTNFMVSIKTDGTLWAWGKNNAGQLGLNISGVTYSSPKQVGALTNWASITAGFAYVVALKTDGTLWAWGNNVYGQLGTSNTTYYSSPKQVGALTTWSQVSSLYFSMSAIKTDGTLWTWGYNAQGQSGLGNITNYSSPKQVGALTNWYRVNSSWRYCLATKTDGTLWSWGDGGNGQLGLGNTTNYSSPKQIGALTTWVLPSNINGGGYSGYAIATT
jgi:alpha-tubulin suppressor-like RCC1 family protein